MEPLELDIFVVVDDRMSNGTEYSAIPGDKLVCTIVDSYFWLKPSTYKREKEFVVIQNNQSIYGRVVKLDPQAQTITISSLNEKYPDEVVHIKDITKLYKVMTLQRLRKREG